MIPKGQDIRSRLDAFKKKADFTYEQLMLMDALYMIGPAIEAKMGRALTHDEMVANLSYIELEGKYGRELTEREKQNILSEVIEFNRRKLQKGVVL